MEVKCQRIDKRIDKNNVKIIILDEEGNETSIIARVVTAGAYKTMGDDNGVKANVI